MRKIVLTSCGIIDSKLKEQFYNLLDKDIKTIKLLFITIAVYGEKDTDRTWLEEEYATILDLGIKEENISKTNKFQMLEFVYYAEIDSFESIELPNDGWDKFKIIEIKDIDNIDIRPKTINNLIKCDEYSYISHNVNYDWA